MTSEPVAITLNKDEQRYLFDLVKLALERGTSGKGLPELEELPVPPTENLKQNAGAFVTYTKNGSLRGCIGNMGADSPLYITVFSMAWHAAFGDNRFTPITKEELPSISPEISVLGPLSECPSQDLIEIGKHGVALTSRGRTAVFLPQVPLENGWTATGTLEQLCRKAHLPPGTWRDRTAVIYWYEATVIHPEN